MSSKGERICPHQIKLHYLIPTPKWNLRERPAGLRDLLFCLARVLRFYNRAALGICSEPQTVAERIPIILCTKMQPLRICSRLRDDRARLRNPPPPPALRTRKGEMEMKQRIACASI